MQQSRHNQHDPQLPLGRAACCHSLGRWLLLLALIGTACAGLAGVLRLRWSANQQGVFVAASTDAVTVAWMFEVPRRGAIISSPLVTSSRIYLTALHDTAFINAGAVYCLDRLTGEPLWQFDDGGKMQHSYSSPCLAAGRLYVGEGMHANFTCKLYCLDAASGQKLWDFTAAGHIESSPCVAAGMVYFGAGDDGLHCLDAATGRKVWQFQGAHHIDANPAISGGRLYVGSGVSRKHPLTEALCLDADDGRLLWRCPTNLPVWGSPVVAGDDVYLGLGNGRLTVSAAPPETPAGALLCVDGRTGQVRWRHGVRDAVFTRAAVDERHVFFGARDGYCHCLDRRTGQPCWTQNLGSPVLTSPALVDGRLYVIASGGRVCCLDPDNGRSHWTFDVATHSHARPQLVSSPAVVAEPGPNGPTRRLYFGAELSNPASNAAILYCLRE